MTQVYKIDESQLGKIGNRIFKNWLLLNVLCTLAGILPELTQRKSFNLLSILMTMAVMAFVSLLFTFFIASRTKKAIGTSEIMLDDYGVMSNAENMPFRQIDWENLEIDEKKSGAVHLYDKSISAFSRRMYGKGWIIIHPEVEDREALLNELYKRIAAL